MKNTFKSLKQLIVNHRTYHYHSIKAAEEAGLADVSRLPYSLKILLENQLRFEDGVTVTQSDIEAFTEWLSTQRSQHEIAYRPARVLMQDFTGVPAIVDLATMRDTVKKLGGDPQTINPLCPVDLVIDHSVQVDSYGNPHAYQDNVSIEMQRNHERYSFLKWGQQSFVNFQVVPPGTGICHQVNLEYLGKCIWQSESEGKYWAYPDTLVGTDSHTTMINGLGILGWGVGGIEAEAAMLGQPISLLIPEVVGVKLLGELREGITATDLVLTITQMLRKKGVVGKFVEFFGPGLTHLTLADRATIANMSPEYGATCGLFPIDKETLKYLELSGRDEQTLSLVQAYAKAQGMWHDEQSLDPVYTDVLTLDLSQVEPSLAGPKRPQDRVALSQIAHTTQNCVVEHGHEKDLNQTFPCTEQYHLHHGDIAIAAITSCTNTSNPSVMIAAGLLAKKAVEKGLMPKPWVKSSLAPGSKVVTDYLKKTGLTPYLEQIGFYLVGYGCTTCIGNSGPLSEPITQTINDNDLVVSAVLSGNRNFEGRIHPLVKANWLASPPLVVAFALAGTTRIDLTQQPIGINQHGQSIYLKDIWPTSAEINEALKEVQKNMFSKEYAEVFEGDEKWHEIHIDSSDTYHWAPDSTYVKRPPFFEGLTAQPKPISAIKNSAILALLGDSVTTDHISPAGSIKANSPAGLYLQSLGVAIADFNSYGARRGNHEVMMRGTFANIRIRNEMVDGVEGGVTRHYPGGETLSIYDAAVKYQQEHVPLIVIAGKEYGTGSSRDWAAKGPALLGVKAVLAESFERIHRSNLVGMGILPLEFKNDMTRKTLQLKGDERIDISISDSNLSPGMDIPVTIHRADGTTETFVTRCRIDTQNECDYYRNGGVLPFVLRSLVARVKSTSLS